MRLATAITAILGVIAIAAVADAGTTTKGSISCLWTSSDHHTAENCVVWNLDKDEKISECQHRQCGREQRRIPGKPGCLIEIDEVGICGDADSSSGSVMFKVGWDDGANDYNNHRGGDGSGLNPFRFGAGQHRGRGAECDLHYTSWRNNYRTRWTTHNRHCRRGQSTTKRGHYVNFDFADTWDNDGLRCEGGSNKWADGKSYDDGEWSSSYRGAITFKYTCWDDCPTNQYRSNPSVENSCKQCTKCKEGYWGSQTCTTEHDRECSKCEEAPGKNYYADPPCGRDTPPVYHECRGPCGSDEYQVNDCGENLSDRICRKQPICSGNEYEMVPPTDKSPRICAPVRSKCPSGMLLVSPATETSDIRCKYYGPECVFPLQYESKAPTATEDRVCKMTTVCAADEFEIKAVTRTTDRACKKVKVCGDGFVEDVAPTATSDRTCKKYVPPPPPPVCRTCPFGSYEFEKCYRNNPTVCRPWRVCKSDEVLASAGTPMSDRVCVKKGSLQVQGSDCDGGQIKTPANIKTDSKSLILEGSSVHLQSCDGTIDLMQEFKNVQAVLTETIAELAAEKEDA